MKLAFFTIAILFAQISFSQSSKITDNILNKVCAEIETSKQSSDSAKVMDAFRIHLFPLMKDMNQEEFTQTYNYVFLRLQRICAEFYRITSSLSPHRGDWQDVPQKPATLASFKDCDLFKTYSSLSYLENSGDTVKVVFTNGYWEDHFNDGTFSRLKMHWLNNCEFQIEFVESNNLSRKSFSKAGDKYNYQIVKKEAGYYLMSVCAADQQKYTTFKFYY